MRNKVLLAVLVLGLLTALSTGRAWAEDTLEQQVTAAGAAVDYNGMTPGTIHVDYTVTAAAYTPGYFGTFTVNLDVVQGDAKPLSAYPQTITLVQQQHGDCNLVLAPATSSFTADGIGSLGSTSVSVTVPAAGASCSSPLVGVLNFTSDAKLGTATTIIVKLYLVPPPTTQCLYVANIIGDQPYGTLVTSTYVNVNNKKGTVVATTPYGQLSDNIVIANNCPDDQSFDLNIGLDPSFATNGAQAVETYSTLGLYSESNFVLTAFGTGTPSGTNLCLSGITLPAGHTFLASVHMGIKNEAISALPAVGTCSADSTKSCFSYAASVYETGSSGCTVGTLHPLATPDPALIQLPFTIK